MSTKGKLFSKASQKHSNKKPNPIHFHNTYFSQTGKLDKSAKKTFEDKLYQSGNNYYYQP